MSHVPFRAPAMLTAAQRMKAGIIANVATPAIAALFRTLTVVTDGREHYDGLMAAGTPPILALWHGRILPAIHCFRDRGIVVITSQNFDGEWIARIIRRFGYSAARGSSSRGGARALVQLRRELAAGHPVAFTIDGPRGPARAAQPGAVWLAGATGHPVVPFHVEADRCWTSRSWDRGQIPKPFARLALVIGEPCRVDATDEATIEAARMQLERALEALEVRARALLPQRTAGRG